MAPPPPDEDEPGSALSPADKAERKRWAKPAFRFHDGVIDSTGSGPTPHSSFHDGPTWAHPAPRYRPDS